MAEARRPSLWPALAVLAALTVPLFFLGIGRVALLDPDEPYYAVPAIEMLRSGSWLVPQFHGRPWFDKPVLFYWMVLGAFRVFGTTEFAARIGSSLAALGGVLALFFHARRRVPAADGSVPAFLPAIVLATSLQYAVLARFAITDMTLTLFLTLGMIAAQRFVESRHMLWIGLAGAAFGLASLTKGPVGLVLPALALALWSALARRGDFFRPAPLAVGALAAAATGGPWFLYMAVAHRELLLGTFLGEGNLGRFLAPEHRTSPFFYAAVLGLGLIPWSGALPFALVESGKSAWGRRRTEAMPAAGASDPRKARADEANGETSPLFELCWFSAVLLLFSLPASRLATYVLPAFPPAALLLARYWSFRLPAQARPESAVRSRAWVLPAIAGVPCGLLIVASANSSLAKAWGADPAIVGAIGVLVAAGGTTASLLARRGMLRGFLAAQAATSVLVILVLVFLAAPQVETRHSARLLVEELRRRGLDAEVVGAVRERDFSTDFYLGRTLPRVSDRRSLEDAVTSHPGGIWVVPKTNLLPVTRNRRLVVEVVVRGRTRRRCG